MFEPFGLMIKKKSTREQVFCAIIKSAKFTFVNDVISNKKSWLVV